MKPPTPTPDAIRASTDEIRHRIRLLKSQADWALYLHEQTIAERTLRKLENERAALGIARMACMNRHELSKIAHDLPANDDLARFDYIASVLQQSHEAYLAEIATAEHELANLNTLVVA